MKFLKIAIYNHDPRGYFLFLQKLNIEKTRLVLAQSRKRHVNQIARNTTIKGTAECQDSSTKYINKPYYILFLKIL